MFNPKEGKFYPKVTQSQAIIRFQDCDPFQHLNNTNYFNYFFNAREDQVGHLYDFNVSELYKEFNTGWVVYNHQISYIRPAMLGEWVQIFSSLIYFDVDTIVVEYYMTDDEQKQLKTLLWSTLKYIDMKTGKKTPHQDKALQYLSAILLDDFAYSNTGFQARIGILKEKIKNTINS
jgi:acyl-CoA thioester hydrolase